VARRRQQRRGRVRPGSPLDHCRCRSPAPAAGSDLYSASGNALRRCRASWCPVLGCLSSTRRQRVLGHAWWPAMRVRRSVRATTGQSASSRRWMSRPSIDRRDSRSVEVLGLRRTSSAIDSRGSGSVTGVIRAGIVDSIYGSKPVWPGLDQRGLLDCHCPLDAEEAGMPVLESDDARCGGCSVRPSPTPWFVPPVAQQVPLPRKFVEPEEHEHEPIRCLPPSREVRRWPGVDLQHRPQFPTVSGGPLSMRRRHAVHDRRGRWSRGERLGVRRRWQAE